jgi:hypothetical protein
MSCLSLGEYADSFNPVSIAVRDFGLRKGLAILEIKKQNTLCTVHGEVGPLMHHLWCLRLLGTTFVIDSQSCRCTQEFWLASWQQPYHMLIWFSRYIKQVWSPERKPYLWISPCILNHPSLTCLSSILWWCG